ncbi:MAG: FHA domain-containing protein [Myxococcaceae bacterium]|nr:FHA domain-containing protein [Myxococcaceae bacterium]
MAGARDVATFGVKYLNPGSSTGEAAFLKAVIHPVLLWLAPPSKKEEPLLFATRAGGRSKRPSPGRAMFFFVEKSVKNAFTDEVTVGRTSNNDVTIEENSVSRFHAYFKPGAKGAGWTLVDAKSTAGTYVGGKKLEPKTPVVLTNAAVVRIGDVELQFLEPKGFWQYMQELIKPRR